MNSAADTLTSPTLLVIDDDPDISEIIEAIVVGHQFLFTHVGERGLVICAGGEQQAAC